MWAEHILGIAISLLPATAAAAMHCFARLKVLVLPLKMRVWQRVRADVFTSECAYLHECITRSEIV
jgi:hypothetical protein